jgi:tetrapyrrole methylase family protein / MazG family protein
MINSFKELVDIAKKLRGPEGCPWDKSLSLSDVPKHLQEELDEVMEAIEKNDYENLREELGDVLFNLILMCVMAEEAGHFKMKDVLDEIQTKIVNRHTWVFGDDKADTPEEALAIWKKNKEKEKQAKKEKQSKQ